MRVIRLSMDAKKELQRLAVFCIQTCKCDCLNKIALVFSRTYVTLHILYY